jgi:hypothetical protein
LGPVSLDQPSDGAAHAAFSVAMATSVDRNVSCTDPTSYCATTSAPTGRQSSSEARLRRHWGGVLHIAQRRTA